MSDNEKPKVVEMSVTNTQPEIKPVSLEDYKKGFFNGVVAVGKDEVVNALNSMGASLQDVSLEKVSRELSRSGLSEDYGNSILKVASRDSRKEILKGLGITAETGDDYRLVFYNDKSQHVVFKGKLDEKTHKLTLTDRLVLDANIADMVFGQFNPDSKNRTEHDKVDDKKIADSVMAILTKPLQPLPEGKSIEIDATNFTPKVIRNFERKDHPIGIEKIDLPPEELKKLETKVTLIALADKAMSGDVKFASEHNNVPRKGPAPEVGLA